MPDGALKSANVESESSVGQGAGQPALGVGGKVAVGIMGLSVWMLLMTAIYFHTWFEKVSLRIEDKDLGDCANSFVVYGSLDSGCGVLCCVYGATIRASFEAGCWTPRCVDKSRRVREMRQ